MRIRSGNRVLWWAVATVAAVAIGAAAYFALREPPVVERMRSTLPLSFDDADSAVAVMQAIDTATLRTEKERALHTLYLQNALYKQNRGKENLAALDTFENYFASRPDNTEKMLYLYLHGVSLYERKKYPEALRRQLHALKIAEANNYKPFIARICLSIQNVYTKQMNSQYALKYSIKAMNLFKECQENDMYRWQLWFTAQCYLNESDHDKSLELLAQARDLAEEANDNYLLDYIGRTTAKNYQAQKKYRESINHLQGMNSKEDAYDYYNLAYDYYFLGDIDSARYYGNLLSEVNNDNVEIVNLLALHDHDYEKASKVLQKLFNDEEIYYKGILKENIAGIESDFHAQELKEKKQQLKERTVIFVLLAFIMLLLVVIVIAFYLKKRHDMQREADDFVARTELLKNKYDSIAEEREREIKTMQLNLLNVQRILKDTNDSDRDKIDNLEKRIKESNDLLNKKNQELELAYAIKNELRKRFEMLNEICLSVHLNQSLNSYTDHNEAYANKRIVSSLIKYINKYRIDDITIANIEDSLDCLYENIMTDFKAAFPVLYKRHHNLFMYCVMGLETHTIEYLLNVGSNTLRSQVHRLKKQINESGNPKKDKFLVFLQKRKS